MAFGSVTGYDGAKNHRIIRCGEGNMDLRLSAIHLYPVKGIRGVTVAGAHVAAAGLQGDRRWVIVDDGGQFISQRSHPGLALITGAFDGRALTLAATGRPTLPVPVPDGKTRLDVTVWRDTVSAAAAPEADRWLADVLGQQVHLAYMDESCVRPVSSDSGRSGDTVSFADGYPLLVISRASLDDLNARLEHPVPMDRFRPNLVIDGCPAFAEDRWTRFRIGTATFRHAGLCARCSVTTVDQRTGRRNSPEPLRTLATYRREGDGVVFGVNLIPETCGEISTGDAVSII